MSRVIGPAVNDFELPHAAAAKWSDAQCGPQAGLEDFIAEDFQGTFTSGQRYGQAEAVTTDPVKARLSRDCQIGEVRVRFFACARANMSAALWIPGSSKTPPGRR